MPTDLYFYGPDLFNEPGWLQAGDVVTLWAGTLTTMDSFAFAPPTGVEFSTFLFDNWPNLNRISADGVSTVPEPSALGLVALALASLALTRRRDS